MWWILACVPEDLPVATPGSDTGAATAGTWELDAPEPCPDPVPVSWREEPLPVVEGPTPTGPDPGGVPWGEVGWWEQEGGPLILATSPDHGLLGFDLATGARADVALEEPLSGLAFADVDADGQLDLLTAGYGVTVIYAFDTPEARIELLPKPVRTFGPRDVLPLDLEGDGDLDLVITWFGGSPDEMSWTLQRNTPQGFVEEIIQGAPDFWGVAFDALALDVDRDRDPDVVICNDQAATWAPNGVLINEGGELAPAEDALGLDYPGNCMGITAADVNADGALDVVNADATQSMVLIAAEGQFFAAGAALGLPVYGRGDMDWGVAAVDGDNDGLPDLFFGHGDFFAADYLPGTPSHYVQQSDGSFLALDTFADAGMSRAIVAEDRNGDGVVDLLIGDALRSPRLYVSEGCSVGGWIEVEAPSGSEVAVTAGGRTWAAVASAERSFASAGPARAHIGLGEAVVIDRLSVTPPWGEEHVYDGTIPARSRVRWRGP